MLERIEEGLTAKRLTEELETGFRLVYRQYLQGSTGYHEVILLGSTYASLAARFKGVEFSWYALEKRIKQDEEKLAELLKNRKDEHRPLVSEIL